MSKLVFEKKFRIHTYETDTNKNLSLPSLFNFLQDIAASHASELHFGKDDLDKKNRIWVLSRIFTCLEEYPSSGDEIIIRTWPKGIDRIFALRNFEILNADGKRIGGAASNWIILNKDTKRPVRPDYLLSLLKGDIPGSSPVDRGPVKIPVLESGGYESPVFQVRYSDLDVNMHVNNVKYLQWALDAYPLEFRMRNRVKSLEVNYLSESFPGDSIKIMVKETDSGKFDHSVLRIDDSKELCRVRAEWIN